MKPVSKLFSLLTLVVLATFIFVPSAQAFDGRSGEKIVIPQDEVINDDLYLGGTEIIVEGTINGDLMAGGQTVVINGKVTGDLFVAGTSVTINGEVGDDVFAAAGAVTLGPSAKVGDDVITTGMSVETRHGSEIGGSLLVGAGQGLLVGNVGEDLLSGTANLRLEGSIGRDAIIRVGSAKNGFSPSNFSGPNNPPMPSVPAGLTFGPDAKVNGKLEYTSQDVVDISSAISANVTHKLPPMDQELSREITRRTATTSFFFDLMRRMLALLLIGLLIAWLAPRWITRTAEMVESRPLPSLGIGLVGLVATPILFFTALGSIILLAIIFGLLSLGSLTGLTLLTGFPLLGLAFVAFLFIVSYLCQAVAAYLVGRWIVSKVQPEWNSKIYWPLLIGLVLFALLFAIPVLGGFLQFAVVLAGLGAIISLMLLRTPAIPAPAPVTTEPI
jgi:cytoskeletal protein CcmA (bactofilin family)